jgi:hypothetical protein
VITVRADAEVKAVFITTKPAISGAAVREQGNREQGTGNKEQGTRIEREAAHFRSHQDAAY